MRDGLKAVELFVEETGFPGVHGPLIQLFNVKDDRFLLPIEVRPTALLSRYPRGVPLTSTSHPRSLPTTSCSMSSWTTTKSPRASSSTLKSAVPGG